MSFVFFYEVDFNKMIKQIQFLEIVLLTIFSSYFYMYMAFMYGE